MKQIKNIDYIVGVYIEKIKTSNVKHLEMMYSPFYDKSFSELNDEEIEKQVRLWVEIENERV